VLARFEKSAQCVGPWCVLFVGLKMNNMCGVEWNFPLEQTAIIFMTLCLYTVDLTPCWAVLLLVAARA